MAKGHLPVSVSVQKLYKSYKTPVLEDITLDVPQGQILGIIGKSGAGKSTLVRCLNGLESPTSGTILIENTPFTGVSETKRRLLQHKIGNVFQNVNLLTRLTALENVMFPLKLLKTPPQESRVQALSMLRMVGLHGKEDLYPHQLSGGQAQRVAIARALVGKASLLLCDEFTSALDPETSLEILELLRDLNKRLGITIILITHDMAVIREICDEVCVLEKGKIVEKDRITSLLLHPRHAVTKSLMRNLITKELPHHLQDRLQKNPSSPCTVLLRLFFHSQVANTPVLSTLMKTYDVPLNILVGHLDHVRETAFGSLVISLPFESKTLKKLMKSLDDTNVATEILGYIPDGKAP